MEEWFLGAFYSQHIVLRGLPWEESQGMNESHSTRDGYEVHVV